MEGGTGYLGSESRGESMLVVDRELLHVATCMLRCRPEYRLSLVSPLFESVEIRPLNV